jgi:hypothetical protein
MGARIIAAATVAGLTVAGAARASRRAADRAAREFYDRHPPAEEWPATDGIPSRAPEYINRLEMFGSFHAADRSAVARLLPSEEIQPVRLPDGRAIVFVGGFHYRDITNAAVSAAVLPYGEVTIAAMVSQRAAPPLVPLAAAMLPLPAAWRAGMFPLFLPVTHRWARDGGWAMGIAKFVADLDFAESVVMREVRAAEHGRSILRLRVPADGTVGTSNLEMLTYASAEGRLWVIEAPMFGYQHMQLGGRGVELELGDHPVADRLRDLGLGTSALMSLCMVTGRGILPTRRPVGSARPYEGYRGDDRWFGRYTIHYPGTAPVDQYAYLTRQGVEGGVVRGGGRLLEEYATIDADLGRVAPPGDLDGIAREEALARR